MTIARQPCIIAPELERPEVKSSHEGKLDDQMQKLYTTLTSQLGKGKLSMDTSSCCHHAVSRHLGCCAVGFVVYPEDEEDIRICIDRCQESLVTLTTFGSGTSLMGKRPISTEGIEEELALNVVAVDLSSKLKNVLTVSPEDLEIRVQAGITRNDLNKYLEPYGLFFPVDPGANATIGGLIATGADGPMATGYGRMHDMIIDLRVMHSDGTIRTYGRNSVWKELFIGTKGRLGIVLEATLKVFPAPANSESVMASFPVQSDALNAARKLETELRDSGVRLARCEYLDSSCMTRLNESYQLEYPQGPTLILELQGKQSDLAQFRREVFEGFHVQTLQTYDADASDAVWKNRYRVWAVVRPMLIGKLDLPPSRMNQVINTTREVAAQYNLIVHFLATPLLGILQVLVQEENAPNSSILLERLTGFIRKCREELKGVSCYFANEPYSDEHEYEMLLRLSGTLAQPHIFREL